MTPALVLGPLLRYVDRTTATVWVETSDRCEVAVRCAAGGGAAGPAAGSDTFEVEGHHYGYVVLDGLPPGHDQAYEVLLDGVAVWPRPDDPRPTPRVRTLPADDTLDLVFGSCRTDRPHEPPWTATTPEHPEAVGPDALRALSLAVQAGHRALPDLLLLLGDQVYADDGLSPRLRARQLERRGAHTAPVGEVADFEEYTWLYGASWSDPELRWLLSTVPAAMIFDDHDVRGGWNSSAAWRDEMREVPWWPQRVVGAFMAYWLYQHLGNLSPAEVEREGVLADVRADGAAALRRHARVADGEADGGRLVRWSYGRDLGAARLVAVDSRSGRVLAEGERAMLREDEWELVEGHLRGDCGHLLVASSIPVVLERSLHDVERWDDALCAGVWGRRFQRFGERLRQRLNLEHWAAFPDSFTRLMSRLGEVAAGRRGAAPATVVLLSGDVHHSYVAPVRFPALPADTAPVVQVVSSPFRQRVPRRTQRLLRLAATPIVRLGGRVLARAAGLPAPGLDWSMETRPLIGNGCGTLRLTGRAAELTLHRAVPDGDDVRLAPVFGPVGLS